MPGFSVSSLETLTGTWLLTEVVQILPSSLYHYWLIAIRDRGWWGYWLVASRVCGDRCWMRKLEQAMYGIFLLLYQPVTVKIGGFIIFESSLVAWSTLALYWRPVECRSVTNIDIEYNKRLDRQRPCLEGDFNRGSNNMVQSNKSVWRRW